LGGIAGYLLCRKQSLADDNQLVALMVSQRASWICLALFSILLIGLPILATIIDDRMIDMIHIFYRSGTLVFGGGHVVLPLLSDSAVSAGVIDKNMLLSGYSLAQLVPGPLFAISSYVGAAAALSGYSTFLWATVGLIFIFLPGILVAIAGLALWNKLSGYPIAYRGLAGINAAVVGVLAAALYDPLLQNATLDNLDLIILSSAFFLLWRWNFSLVYIVILCVVFQIFRVFW
ncbi:MAG: chromate transporter, partial [Alphaproteobacteria bacterium]|nr:chromate transporter [Alphaproteobacteria bacterium]